MMRPWTRPIAVLALVATAPFTWMPEAAAQTSASPLANGLREKQAADSETPTKDGTAEVTPPEPDVDPKLLKLLGSPRATMQTFLDAMNDSREQDAAMCLDLSKLTATNEARKTKEQELAYKLREVLKKLIKIEVDRYPEEAELDAEFSLNQTHNTDAADRAIAEQIVIAPCDDGLWRFSAATVGVIEQLHEDLLEREKVLETHPVLAEAEVANVPFSIWLSEQFPVGMRKTHFLLAGYLWICLAVILLLGLVADRVTRLSLDLLLKLWFRLRHRSCAPIIPGMWRPIGLFVQCLTWYAATKLIGLPTTLLTVLVVGLKYFAVIAGVWTSFHLIDLAARIASRRATGTRSRFDDLLVPLLSKSLKFIALCVGVVVCVNAFDWEVVGLLGGLGIGGMALAFASQDAIANVFGSLTVLLDRPFEVGDWIVSEDVEGTVESVGFRSTRVRTFYNSIITLPNSRFTSSAVDNMGRRKYRRFKTSICVQYDTTPEQLDAFCEGIRELLRRHPHSREARSHVYLHDFSDSSVDILLYCFFDCPDWSVELGERHRLLLDIMKLAKRLQVQFAFPTRTIQMFQGETTPVDSSIDWSDPHSLGLREATRVAGSVVSDE